MTSIAAQVFHWAVVHQARADPETLELIEWLMARVDETSEHRKAQRAFHQCASTADISLSLLTTRSNSSTIRLGPDDLYTAKSSSKYQIWSVRPRLNRSHTRALISR